MQILSHFFLRLQMNTIARLAVLPVFFLWLANVKIPIGGVDIYIQWWYAAFASFFLLFIMLAHNISLTRTSVTAVVLLTVLLLPTIFYQVTGLTASVEFEHFSGFPWIAVAKLALVFLVFVTFNELLYHKYLTVEFLFKAYVICVLASIGRYVFDFQDLIINLNVAENRPYPEWIGGWNTYSFLLALACMILLGPLQWARTVRYSLLILVIATMFTTLSRGGIVALIVGLYLYWRSTAGTMNRREWFRMLVKAAAVVVLVFGVAVASGLGGALYARFVLSFLESQYVGASFLSSLSSGRTIMWLDTFAKFTSAEHYYQWIAGYGVGHYAYQTATTLESDMGNQYILFIYEYGVIVGIGLAVWMFKSYFALRWTCELPWARTIKAIFAIFLISNFVESLIYATQAGWLIGVGGAIALDVLRRDRVSKYRSAGVGAGASTVPVSAYFDPKTT